MRGSAVDSGIALQTGKSRVRLQIVLLGMFIYLILAAALIPPGLAQSLTEMSNLNISPGVKAAGTQVCKTFKIHMPIF